MIKGDTFLGGSRPPETKLKLGLHAFLEFITQPITRYSTLVVTIFKYDLD